MADKRPFAKIDTGYIMNPKWFRVRMVVRDVLQDVLPDVSADVVQGAVRTAMQAHLTSILYSAQSQTDGLFPVDAVKALCLITTEVDEAAITALFDVGLWINHPGEMAEVRDYLEHQTSAKSISERSAKARNAVNTRWGNDTERNAGRNAERTQMRNAEEKRREKKRKEHINAASAAGVFPVLSKLPKPNGRYEYPPEFEEFHAAYPHVRGRGDKPGAYRAWRSAVQAGTSPETIREAAHRYATDPNRVDQFTKAATAWLNQSCWDDGPLPARTHGSTDRALEAAQRDLARATREPAPALELPGSQLMPWELETGS